jgi:hypothetical protein
MTNQASSAFLYPVGSQAKFCLFSETPDFRVLRPSPPARPILRGARSEIFPIGDREPTGIYMYAPRRGVPIDNLERGALRRQ